VYEFDCGRAVLRKNDSYRDYALQVKQVCVSAGVPIIYIGYYLRYGREVWSLVIRRAFICLSAVCRGPWAERSPLALSESGPLPARFF
jgi:hypothetical protein